MSELQAVIYLVNKCKTSQFQCAHAEKLFACEYCFQMTPNFCDQGVLDNMQSRFPTVGGGSGCAVDSGTDSNFHCSGDFFEKASSKTLSTKTVIYLYLWPAVIGLQHNQWSCNGVRFLN